MRKLKVAVIGAGSTYTPELMEGFIARVGRLDLREIALMDIDEYRLNVVGGLVGRMIRKAGLDCRCTLTTDLENAVSGCDYVLAQVRVGRLMARVKDEKIPLKYDLIGQETTGIGGFAHPSVIGEQALGLDVGDAFQRFAAFVQHDQQVVHFALAYRLGQVADSRSFQPGE